MTCFGFGTVLRKFGFVLKKVYLKAIILSLRLPGFDSLLHPILPQMRQHRDVHESTNAVIIDPNFKSRSVS